MDCGPFAFHRQKQRAKSTKQNTDHGRLKKNLSRLNNLKGVLREGMMDEFVGGRMPTKERSLLEKDEKLVSVLESRLKNLDVPFGKEKSGVLREEMLDERAGGKMPTKECSLLEKDEKLVSVPELVRVLESWLKNLDVPFGKEKSYKLDDAEESKKYAYEGKGLSIHSSHKTRRLSTTKIKGKKNLPMAAEEGLKVKSRAKNGTKASTSKVEIAKASVEAESAMQKAKTIPWQSKNKQRDKTAGAQVRSNIVDAATDIGLESEMDTATGIKFLPQRNKTAGARVRSNIVAAATETGVESETDTAIGIEILPVSAVSHKAVHEGALTILEHGNETDNLSSASESSFTTMESIERVPEMTDTTKGGNQMESEFLAEFTLPEVIFRETKSLQLLDSATQELQRTERPSYCEIEFENPSSATKETLFMLESIENITEATEVTAKDDHMKIVLSPKSSAPLVISAPEAAHDDMLPLQRTQLSLESEIETENLSTLGGSQLINELEQLIREVEAAGFDLRTTETTGDNNQIGLPPGSTSPIAVSRSSSSKAVVTSPQVPSFKENADILTADCKETAIAETEEHLVSGSALTEENDREAWKSAFKDLMSLGKTGLRAQEIQGFFLYCLLYAQDQEASTSKLVEYLFEDGLITDNEEDSLKKGAEIVKIFQQSAFRDSDEGGLIKIPDSIKDSALEELLSVVKALEFIVRADRRHLLNSRSGSLSRSADQYLLKAGARLQKAPIEEGWEKALIIFLMDNELSSLPNRPTCPDLLMLFLQRNPRLRVIPEFFFNDMPAVKVLNLSKTSITSLPRSLSNLESLEELILSNCDCLTRLPSEVGQLKHLKLLNLHGTHINELPKEIQNVKSLEHLDVSFYGPVDSREYSMLPSELISPGIISSLTSLRILRIAVCPGDLRWIKNAEWVIKEMSNLESLTVLCFYFPKVEYLQRFLQRRPWKGNGLKKFNFVAGHDVKRMVSRVPHNLEFEYNQRGQCLRFVNGETVPKAIVEVLAHTTAFYLDHHLKIKSLSKFGVKNINGLEFCIVRECPEIETIANGKELTFPSLKHLSIHYLENLKSIWHHHMPVGSFASLKYLNVQTCPSLNFLFRSSMSLYISNLEKLVVEDCQATEKLISDDRPVEPGEVLLPNLKSLSLLYLPKLISIWKGSWPSLESLTIYHCPNLRNLHMGSDFKLKSSIKMIKAEKKWWHNLEWDDASLSQELQAYFIVHPEDNL